MSVQSYVKLRKLTAQDGELIEHVLQRVVDELRDLGEEATVELRLSEAENAGARSIYSVRLTSADAVLQTERAESPMLVLITNAKAFLDMADGSYSPVQAYLDGELKCQGNADLARRIIQRYLGGKDPEVRVLPHLTNASYDPAGPDGGSLTVSGRNFTPGGTVVIRYNRGGGQNGASTTADSQGSFTFTEIGIPCGDIGVIVTATDVSSVQFTTSRFSTPC